MPTPHMGPSSWVSMVVIPEESAASKTRGDIPWTWVSMPPGVAMRPSPGITTVPEPTTTSTSSVRSGFPDRPMAEIRPPEIPIEVARTPSSASRTSTLVMTTSHDALVRTALKPIPSRPVRPKPSSSSSPTLRSSCSTSTKSPVSPRRTRSPFRGPLIARSSSGSCALIAVGPLDRPSLERRRRQDPPPA